MVAKSNSNEIRLTRLYDAPVRTVWDAWTIPEQLATWVGSALRVVHTETAPGQRTLFAVEGERGAGSTTLHTTVVLTEEAFDRTRVTVTSELSEEATPSQVEAFVRERPNEIPGQPDEILPHAGPAPGHGRDHELAGPRPRATPGHEGPSRTTHGAGDRGHRGLSAIDTA